MPRGIKKAPARKQWEAILEAEEAGISVPLPLKSHVQQEMWEQEGVQSVFICKKCKGKTLLYVRVKSVECCGIISKPFWKI